jgi:hypothetical protein
MIDPSVREAAKKVLYQINEYGIEHCLPDARLPEEIVKYFVDNYGIRGELHRTCVNCQIRQLIKYDGEESRFKVKCAGVPRGVPGAASKINELATASDISPERAKKLLLSTVDPVAWIELMFGFDDTNPSWHLRSYQKEQLRCNATRCVIRQSRRSGKTFCVAYKLLYHIFNMRLARGRDAHGRDVFSGPDIIVITPYQKQLVTVFEMMERALRRNSELMSEVIKSSGSGSSLYTKTPTFKYLFKNGATVEGFVSGVGVKSDGSGGGTIRSSGAHVIYLDEMDLISDSVLDKVVQPLLVEDPNIILIGTSTPIGKHGRFRHWCLERPDFKEDYFPGTILEHWDQVKDEIIAESTKESFAMEIMALFVDAGYGVFKPTYVYAARADYTYEEAETEAYEFWKHRMGIADRKNLLVSIGIDWNKNAGSEFYVMGFSPSTGLFVGLEATNIPATEYSAEAWKDELRRLNYKWKPQWIYADEGYGHTVIEDLRYACHQLSFKKRKTPFDEETIKIKDRLTAFSFSKNIEIKDPVTGEPILKPGKGLLVENAIALLEVGRMRIPEEDDILRKQLLNYIVDHINPATGKPVYGMARESDGDHRLDAFMLSLVAFKVENSEYAENLVESAPAFVPPMPLELRNIDPGEEPGKILEYYRKTIGGPTLNVLNLVRGGNPAENREIFAQQLRELGRLPGDRSQGRGLPPRRTREEQSSGDTILRKLVGSSLNTSGSTIKHVPRQPSRAGIPHTSRRHF